MGSMTRDDLEKMRAWADAKLATGQEPPCAWYQYMKLRETLDAILAGMAATRSMDHSRQSEQHSGSHLRLVDANDQQDTALSHQVGVAVQLPM